MATQTNEIRTLGPEKAIQAIIIAIQAKHPVMLWGPPGIGKSALVKKAAQNLGIGFIDLRLAQIDAVDLRGMPYKDVRKTADDKEHTVMGFAPSGFMPQEGKGILFLDELPQAPTMVLNAASELLLDRRVGEYILPDGWGLVCAGNRRGDRAGTHEIPAHLKNRLIHMEIKIGLKEWLTWASKASINNDIMEFLRANPDKLHMFNADHLACATLRTWEFASDVLKQNPEKEVREALLAGCLGHGVMIEFESFVDSKRGQPSYEDVIADPKNAPIPADESKQYAFLKMLADKAEKQHASQLVTFFKRNKREWMRSVNERIIQKDPEFLELPEFKAFVDSFAVKTKDKA